VNLIVVGASAGLGRALADRLAQEKHNLLLIAGDEADLKAISADLNLRHSVQVEIAAVRLQCDQNSIEKVLAKASALGNIDGILFPLGYSRTDDDGTLGCDDINRIVNSNMAGIIALCSHYLPAMLQRGEGLLVFFGSVASERGRSSNIVYAAAKRGLQSFAESLRHKCSATNINVQYYQLGYLNTAQTFGKKLPFPAAEPKDAADYIVRNLNKRFGLEYYPWFWRFICLGLRYTPWMVFKKLKF
jgi:short-subunit dehydrogenase